MNEMVSPAEMAAIYFHELHFSSVSAVKKRMSDYEPMSESFLYWEQVHRLLVNRVLNMKSYRAGKPEHTERGK